jgi:hypothetical protein
LKKSSFAAPLKELDIFGAEMESARRQPVLPDLLEKGIRASAVGSLFHEQSLSDELSQPFAQAPRGIVRHRL